jgi:hypothetical protein
MSTKVASCSALLVVLAACGKDEAVPARLKGVSLGTASALAPNGFPSDQSRFPTCIVRYDFSGSAPALPAIECTTSLVGGDPLHWKTTCPSHPFADAEVEVQVDAQHRPIFERRVTSAGEFTFSYLPLRDGPGVTVTAVDAAGNPLRATFARADLPGGVSGAPVPGSGRQEWSWQYDENERLQSVSAVFTEWSKRFLSMDVRYDDAALRIEYASTVDYAGVLLPAGSPVGENGGYDQFDTSLRLVERYWFSGSDQSHYGYRYDDQGRLITAIGDLRRPGASHVQYVQNSIYDCL